MNIEQSQLISESTKTEQTGDIGTETVNIFLRLDLFAIGEIGNGSDEKPLINDKKSDKRHLEKYSRAPCCETLENFQGKADRVNGELGGMRSHYWVMLAKLLTLWAEAGLIENEHTSTF